MRFTQDSPILPDVWTAFAAAPHQPRDLLLNPYKGERTGQVVKRLRERIEALRAPANGEPLSWGHEAPRIAHVPGLVIARLYFNEVIRLVLPSTHWWSERWPELRRALGSAPQDYDPATPFFSEAESATLAGWMAEEWSPRPSRPSADTGPPPPYDVLKLVRLAGLLALGKAGALDPADLEGDPAAARMPPARALVDAFGELFRVFPVNPDNPPNPRSIWNVTLNREAAPMVNRSTKAMKADAGRRLFEISCRELRWAVIDSGVDATHPAFADWATPSEDAPHPDEGFARAPLTADRRRSRVVRTFDFAELRDLLDLDFLIALEAEFDDILVVEADLVQELERRVSLAQQALDALLDEPELPEPMRFEAARSHHARCKVMERLVQTAHSQILAREPESSRLPGSAAKRQARRWIGVLKDRIDLGMEIDWSTLEPLIEDLTPDTPPLAHGTNVAGVLAANWREPSPNAESGWADRLVGVCPDIELVDLRVLTLGPGGIFAPHDFEVISALKFVAHLNDRAGSLYIHGANLSIAIAHDVTRFACGRTPICEECERLVASGVVVVAAAGNSGYANSPEAAERFYRSGSIADPGNAEGVITVGATHRSRPHEYGVSYFSSRGPTGDGRQKPDLVAPGEKIETPSPGQRSNIVDGTSFAAPHASGAAAMLMARYSELMGQPQRIKRILKDTATDLGRERDFQGAGMLDILRALQSI